MSTASHLALKEIWRNRGRFLLFSMVIALITVLILFIAALGEGLGAGNREYIEKLDAELIVYQDIARLSVSGSRLDRVIYQFIRSIDGVRDAGPISFASVAIPMGSEKEHRDVLAASLDAEQILTCEELVAGNEIFFAATGITSGTLLSGVRYHGDLARTESLELRAETGTRRIIQAEHLLNGQIFAQDLSHRNL